MSQQYSDPDREDEPTALPDLEVFYLSSQEAREQLDDASEHERCTNMAGWYYWYCFPGCLPNSDPIGPFDSEADALQDAREQAGDLV